MAQQQNDNLNQMPTNENSFMNDVTGKNYPQNGGNIDPSKVNILWPINLSINLNSINQSNKQTFQTKTKQNQTKGVENFILWTIKDLPFKWNSEIWQTNS